jgi:cytochrome c oxidase subunit 3
MDMAGSLTHDIGVSRRASFTGLFVLLAASTMVFAAFSSAFVVRRGLSDDWTSMHWPPILFVNTVVLLASSVVLDQSRRWLRI